MATVHFYEKPGCINNSRQKALLIQAGHNLIVHDLLQQPWSMQLERLRGFFGGLPVADWFNRAAPAVKNGCVVPETANDVQALALMAADPLLIRRPLIESDGLCSSGFDSELVQRLLNGQNLPEAIEQCPKTSHAKGCSP